MAARLASHFLYGRLSARKIPALLRKPLPPTAHSQSSANRSFSLTSSIRMEAKPSSSTPTSSPSTLNSSSNTPSVKSAPSSKENLAEGLAARALLSRSSEHASKTKPRQKQKLSPEEIRKQNLQMGIILLALGGGSLYFLSRPGTDVPEPSPSDSLFSIFYSRAATRLRSMYQYFAEPMEEKLLPDPLPAPYQRPYTLVINLDDTLIHSSWDQEYGWRTIKRPKVDQFLAYLSQFYEIVVFTSSPFHIAAPVIQQVDPYQSSIMYRLYREATKWVNGKRVKDLRYLNRDLSKVITMDVDETAFSHQPDNAIKLDRWTGDLNDDKLLQFIPFLETLAMSGIPDVRPVLATYKGCDIPKKFSENQQKYLDKIQAQYQAAQAAAPSQPTSYGLSSWLGLGGSRGSTARDGASPTPTTGVNVSELDVISKSQLMQEQFMADWAKMKKEHDEQMGIARAEEEQRLKDQFKNNKYSIWRLITEGPPTPEMLGAPSVGQ